MGKTWEQLAHHRAVNVSGTKRWQVCWWYRKRAWRTGKNTGVQMFLPEMAFSPFGEATVMAEAFPMLSTWPRPTWLLKLRTCQPMTLASCCTAWTWCCDIWNGAERRRENVDIDHQLLPPVGNWLIPETGGSPEALVPGATEWWPVHLCAPLWSAQHQCSVAAE